MAAASLLAVNAFAADAPPAPHGDTPPPHGDMLPPPPPGESGRMETLEDARKKAHEHADKMDKMTESEWAEHQKKRQEFMDKWHKMSPQEKEDFRKKRDERKQERREGEDKNSPAAAK